VHAPLDTLGLIQVGYVIRGVGAGIDEESVLDG